MNKQLALFNIGFRPFFLGGSCYALLISVYWSLVYSLGRFVPATDIPLTLWHAHEMIYGYCMAVVAGFLLTAVQNWTGLQTVRGWPLFGLCSLWLIARLLFLSGDNYVMLAGVFDLMFIAGLSIAVFRPVCKTRNWRQLGIIAKLLLFGLLNLCFYLGHAGVLTDGMNWGVYGGLYLLIALILTIGGRVTPYFIGRGLGSEPPKNPRWPTLIGLLLFLVFFVSEVFLSNQRLSEFMAIGLFGVYAFRLIAWHRVGIWARPLLWGLYLSQWFIVLGFLLFAFANDLSVSGNLVTHLFAYGGIGMVTVAMIVRVTLGHTGRNIQQPPKAVNICLLLLLLGCLARVLLPILFVEQYSHWVFLSQLMWILAWFLLTVSCLSMWLWPRVDGRDDGPAA